MNISWEQHELNEDAYGRRLNPAYMYHVKYASCRNRHHEETKIKQTGMIHKHTSC
jgi:hypothetical protein